ncbi:uncharacterized protein LOC111640471 [Centruroides sculpturatus]|uniref:uncharacterized protein LOC111640471 n=1 Tax=Centruroides sculpturatus TaxID=218467 RepID=UPI000C6EA379|nr:uncharacterized protein LOC111640471 [Centruroides sculpturatus]
MTKKNVIVYVQPPFCHKKSIYRKLPKSTENCLRNLPMASKSTWQHWVLVNRGSDNRGSTVFNLMDYLNETLFENVNLYKGSVCGDDFDCIRHFTKMMCINNKCDCVDNHVYVHNFDLDPLNSNIFDWIFDEKYLRVHGKCYKIVSYRDKCESNAQCQATDENMICSYSSCACNMNYIYVKSIREGRRKCNRKDNSKKFKLNETQHVNHTAMITTCVIMGVVIFIIFFVKR